VLLTNTAKHAKASFAEPKIVIDGQLLRIFVSDDAVGCADRKTGFWIEL
jgi:signal transduction histidine kinase